MITINLDKEFKPFGDGIEIEQFDFPSGCESHIKIKGSVGPVMTVTCRIRNGNDIIRLLLTADALKRNGANKIELFLPYLPFARQDRVMVSGEPLSIKVFSDLLNSVGFSHVEIFDPHSDVSMALINNSKAIDNHKFVKAALMGHEDFYIVSPDAGAYKKIFKLCQYLNYKEEIIMCNKLRDVSNGVIRSVTVSHDDLKGKDCFIIDDICDGGGTFLLLAEELRKRNCGNIYLIVSHGIFSKGLKDFTNINHIYTTDSFRDINSMNEFDMHNERFLHKITQIKLTDIL